MVEMVGFHQVMWLVMLESAKDRILGVDTPASTTTFLRQLCPPLRLPMGLILFLLLLGRTMFAERSITSQ
jgi:hypothetical protein